MHSSTLIAVCFWSIALDFKNFQELFTLFCEYFCQEAEEFEDMIADGLSQLGRSADGTLQVYLNLFLAVQYKVFIQLQNKVL